MKQAVWIAAGLLAVAAGRAAETAGPPAGGGTRDPASMLRAGHPRLWLLEDRLAELKARAAAEPTLARHVADVLAAAAKSKKAIPRDHKLIGPRLLMVSRDYLHHLGLLAFAYRKGGREMIVQLAAPETAAFAVESGERPKPEKTNAGCKRLVVRVPGMQGETRIAVLFSPVWPDGAADDLQPLLPLDGWQGGAK